MVYRWSDNPHVPIDVDLCRIDLENLLDYPNDNGESLVDFPESYVVHRKPSLLQGKRHSNSGCLREVDGINTGVRVGCGNFSRVPRA